MPYTWALEGDSYRALYLQHGLLEKLVDSVSDSARKAALSGVILGSRSLEVLMRIRTRNVEDERQPITRRNLILKLPRLEHRSSLNLYRVIFLKQHQQINIAWCSKMD